MPVECLTIERYKIIKIIHKIVQIVQIHKISLNFKIRVYFSLWG